MPGWTQMEGTVLALYPSDKPGVYYGEAFHEIDDYSPRAEVRESTMKDDIWKKLLAGETIKEVVSSFDVSWDGEYRFCKPGEFPFNPRVRTFSITEEEESANSTTQ